MTRENEVSRVEPKAFRLLLFFLHNPGRLITKDELLNAVWSEAAVTDNSLTRSVAVLRRVLGDDPAAPRFIVTVPTVGYRFLPPVETSDDDVLGNLEQLPAAVPGRSDSSGAVHSSVSWFRRWSLVAAALLLLAVGRALWSRRQASQTELGESQLTRHSSDNPLSGVAISPDGKYLLFGDITGVHITLLRTGEVRDIERQSEPEERQINWSFQWFPDGSQFLVNEFGGDGHSVIWQGSVLAGKLKKVRDNAIAWTLSPDGSSIVLTKATRINGPMSELWLMDTKGNDLRKLDDAGEANAFGFVQWSPDSDRIAYLRYAGKSGQFQISMETRELKGGPPVTLLSDNALRSLYWLQDGRLLYVLGESDRTGETCNYWVARLNKTEGTFSAAPKQLTHNTGFCVDTTSATSDSKKLVFLKRSFEVSVYVAGFEPGTKRISPPRPLTSTEGQEWPVAWTPDSREVVFASNRGPKMGFFRYPFTGGEVTPIVTGIESAGLGNLIGRVTPDGAWLLYEPFPAGYVPGTSMDLKKVAMAGGTPQVILRDALFDTPSCALAPSRLCAIATVAKDQLVFWSVDPVAGRGPELGRFRVDWKSDYGWALSPDGTRIAIQRRDAPEIYVLSIETHTMETITVKGWTNGISLDWTADGSGFFICTLQPRAVLLHVDLEGNATPLWEPKGSNTTWALPSPDGQHIAMPSAAVNSNAWMIKLF
ncbi:winged helix-turn-helix domain-containing protein [Tunturibacter empetritectus]|uniref:DNA-binding winged helix-turn-helix (WHTH) protein/Tol biopolymer transport system component n=1 Tax=Tunturiibacter empetritectus TaxID=3069691 RepID=A0A7W8MSK7_9BACT|nr:winged helix-turn-helix domain-containing protein [Edaphobacter lichenicola]MBB5318793.1 DNA-binding winged helix-turn-helix (wHTH) protein/Tol biopolymer transport system component [Edaphobacter lichenicola]